MQMFRDNNPGMNYKGLTPFDRPYCLPQIINVADQQIVADSLQQIDREESDTARMSGASIVRHVRSIAVICMRRNALRLLRPTMPGSERFKDEIAVNMERRTVG